MKKILVLVLALALVMALAACGGQTAGSAQQGSSAAQSGAAASGTEEPSSSEAPVETIPPVSSDVPVETFPPTNPEGPITTTPVTSGTPSSDGSNGSAGIEKIVIDDAVKPENFKLTDSGEKRFQGYYETYTLDNITYQDVLKYEEKLIAQGFYIQYGAYGTETEADNLAYEVKYSFRYTGKEFISDLEGRAKRGEKDPGVLTVTIHPRDLSRYNLPALPEGDWRIDDNAESGWVMHRLNSTVNCTKAERVALAKSYVETLKGSGYTLNAEEHPEGKEGNYVAGYIPYYYYYAEDGENRSVEVVVCTSEEGDYYRLKGIEDWSKIEITFEKAD